MRRSQLHRYSGVMTSTSPALLQKIARARSNAPFDLPLVRDCARVVLKLFETGATPEEELATLKTNHGSNWSVVTALQLLSGRRGEFAAACAPQTERVPLFMAHLLSKSVCHDAGFAPVNTPTQAEWDAVRTMAEQAARASSSPS